MIKYGLLYKGEVLNFVTRGDWDQIHELTHYGDKMWLVNTPEHANYVRSNSTPWYSAEYDTPINGYDEDDLTVIEVEININSTWVNKLPSFEELMRSIYADNPEHVDYVLKTFPKSDWQYSLYDYNKYLELK